MEKSKITGFTVQDFKRVKFVEIQPNENGMTIIGGDNGQGKTSILDALGYALGGEAFRPSAVNNTEADGNAYIKVEIDGLVVERAGKNGALKVTDARGMRGNQTLLNTIVSKFAIDLGNFMKASDGDKTKMLLDMFPELQGSLEALKAEDAKIREERADMNRDIKRLQVVIDGMPQILDAPQAETSLDELNAKLADANRRRTAVVAKIEAEKAKKGEEAVLRERIAGIDKDIKIYADTRDANIAKKLAEIESIGKAIEEMQEKKATLEASVTPYREEADNAIANLEQKKAELAAQADKIVSEGDEAVLKLEDEGLGIDGEIEQINWQMKSAGENNEKFRKTKERQDKLREINSLREQSDKKTAELQEIDRRRTELLQKANLPLPDLSIDADGMLLYKGQKWDCMSGSERLKVATAISMNTKPGCGFVLVDGLEALDGKTLREFDAYLTERNMQCIGTIVGENNATVVIEDGCVKE